jgi:hypothetical protein
MKKFFAILFVLTAFFANAQKGTWGIKGGLNFNLSEVGLEEAHNGLGDIFDGEKSENGWHAGLVTRSYLTESFFVQFQGLYSQTSNTINGKSSYNIPIEQQFDKKLAEFDILPGFQILKIIRVQGGVIGQLALSKDYADTFGPFNVGYNVGAGLTLGKFNVDIAYNGSFQNHYGEWRVYHSRIILRKF